VPETSLVLGKILGVIETLPSHLDRIEAAAAGRSTELKQEIAELEARVKALTDRIEAAWGAIAGKPST